MMSGTWLEISDVEFAEVSIAIILASECQRD
jgi:hypothetical protein